PPPSHEPVHVPAYCSGAALPLCCAAATAHSTVTITTTIVDVRMTPPWLRERYHRSVTSLVRSGEDEEALRARLGELEASLRERAAEIARARTDLEAFRIRYRQEVGLLHEELDELERAVAEAELGEIN